MVGMETSPAAIPPLTGLVLVAAGCQMAATNPPFVPVVEARAYRTNRPTRDPVEDHRKIPNYHLPSRSGPGLTRLNAKFLTLAVGIIAPDKSEANPRNVRLEVPPNDLPEAVPNDRLEAVPSDLPEAVGEPVVPTAPAVAASDEDNNTRNILGL